MAKTSNGVPKETISITVQITVLDRLDRYCIKTDQDRSRAINCAVTVGYDEVLISG